MNGTLLRFYVTESRKHEHELLYQWLLECAHASGIGGGSAFRALAGFGQHGVMRAEHFYELAADVPVAVEFVTTEQQADALLARLRELGIDVFYVRSSAEFASTGA
ncbi:MAG: DUF190 domain-containing protein [Casimicrobiaceae bacterium]